ncbi:MAG TPA: hypothetical protein VIH37_00090, partial [Candidatus Limnocylindrales bacterium]
TATLNWTVSGATALAIAADVGASPGPVTGTAKDVQPTATTTYTLTASNAGGTTTAKVTVAVKDTAPVIHSFASIPNNIQAGDSAQIIWDVTGAATLSIAADVGPSPGVVTGATGSIPVTPAVTTLYTMTATSAGGTVTTSVTQILVAGGAAQGPQIAAFAASPATIARGDSTTLSWTVTGADSVSIAPEPGAVTGTSATVSPAQTTTYTLTATSTYGTVTQTATVTVTGPTAPTINAFAATPAFITAGQSSNLTWSVSGADSIQIAPDIGEVTGTSRTVTPAATTAYTLTATNANGSSTATAVVTLYTAGNGQVTHPRIWVTPASLNALTAKAAANDAAWVRLRADCDYYATLPVAYPDQTLAGDSINGGYQYNDYLKPATELGLGYLVTKTADPVRAAKYAAKEKELLLALSDPVKHGRPSTDSGYGIRGYVPALALGYDWIYETLSDSERAQVFTEINR